MTDDLPPGWVKSRLGDLCTPRVGKVIPAQDDPRPYLSLDNIAGDVGRIGGWERARDYRSQSVELSPGDVAYARLRPYLNKVAMVDREALGSAELIVLPPSDALMPEFLQHQLLSSRFVKFAQDESTGDRPRLKWRQMRHYVLEVPSPVEQQRIVAGIDERFSYLEAAERSLAVADGRLNLLYRSVAVDALDRPEWDWITLGEIAEVKGGITKDSKREVDPEFEEFPYLRVANVQRGYLDLSTVSTIRADPRKAHRLLLRPGDILFNEGGDRDKLGRGWVWEGQIDNCIHQNHVFRARLVDDRFDPYFVSLHANSWGQRWFNAHGKQTTNLASLNLTTLKSFPVPAPALEEQQATVSRLRLALDSVQRQRLDLERVTARASTLRRSIRAEAFAGRLVSRDLGDESAAVLAG